MWSKLKTNTTPPSGLVVGCNLSSVSFNLPFDNPDMKIIARHYRRSTPEGYAFSFCDVLSALLLFFAFVQSFFIDMIENKYFRFLFRSSATFKHVQLSPSRQLLFQLENTKIKNIFSVPLSCLSLLLLTFFIRKIIHNGKECFSARRDNLKIFSLLYAS